MGIPAFDWIKVQPRVAKFARVCSYDRAGYGWSDVGSEPRTSVQIAKELRTLMNAAGQEGPYFLVGHSFGGFNVGVFTELHPADVLGVVLVDGAHEDEEERINEILSVAVMEQERRNDLWNERVNQFLTSLHIHLGIQRLQDQQNNMWINVLQAEEAHLSTRGKHVVVSDSDHMIPFERPDTVIGAIREVWDALRSK